MSHKGEAYSASGAFFLDNPIRRWLQPPSELIGILAINPNDIVMDFGCGPGFFTIELAKKAKRVVAVDLSPEMLKKAENKGAKAGVKNIEFMQSDGTKIQLDARSVDLIFLVTVFHEIGDTQRVLAEFHRILKPSGSLVIVEVVKKGTFPGAPIQNPEVLKKEVETGNFNLTQMQPYKNYGIFFFNKNVG
ncbi:MAG: class I SAM-dependent methyltransferase [Candidatus Bathyarchaeia archaeon]|jgi:ubiquinone/menaquinone biosynthesis C-methylase UbiE